MILPAGLGLAGYAQMSALILVAACVQGIGGIGFAMFAAPIAGLFFPSMAPASLLVLGGLVSLLCAFREPAHIDWAMARYGTLGRLAGGALAIGVVALVPLRYFSAAYALALLAAVLLTMKGWKVQPSRRNTCLAGVVSGVMGTITSAGAPPFAILTQRLEPPQIRATVGCILALGAAVSLALLAAAGRFGLDQFGLAISLFPWLLLGFFVSSRIGRRVSARGVKHFLLGLAALGALGILVKAAI
ncbi:MAG TPA: TSUP family transporter [Ramlibacter sp.]|nr:TSUP family transporter [Ramlibacter sp.]